MADNFLDALEGAVEVEGAAFLEGEFEGYGAVLGGEAAGGGGEEDGLPDIGAEEGGGSVGVLEGEDGGGEGLEGWGWDFGEVD